ncbi:PAS domain S-box protein [Pseudodesulfovibrio sp.]|uniref:PAS domain S-box protein n=1 Tax=Pseudodesulfovibrio sp. TaxID=2035812 RepID=UPI0026264DD0|nr:PAS domain S-box protein [Pseudodesulfovibrio sp.]MDD3312443.1 PAS domain S-box protein [Pseudodesulfovibrio sp.]
MGNGNRETMAALRRHIQELQARIRELESRPDAFRDMVDSLPQLVFELDLNGRFTYVNDYALHIYGFTRQDIEAGVNIAQTIHPDSLDLGMRALEDILSGAPSPGHEYLGLRKDGSPIPVKVYAQRIIKDGRPRGARGVVVDISDIKQAEAALVESEQYYRTLFENTGTAMVIFSDDGVIRSCNSQFQELSGYPASEIVNKMTWMDRVDPDDLALMRTYHSARGNGRAAPRRYNFTFLVRGGVRKRVHVSVGLIPGTGDRVCSLIDITESENAREALRKSEERYELVVRGAYDGIWDWDLPSNTIYFSPRYKVILGYRDGEMPNRLRSWIDSLHPEDRDRALDMHYQCIEGGLEHFETEFRLRHKDGTYRWILARGIPSRDADGTCRRLAGTITDITEWKKTDQALKFSERQYRDIFTYANNGIFQSTPDGRLIKANAAAARILGYESPEALLAEVLDIATQCYAVREDRQRFLDAIRERDSVEQCEMHLRRRDGKPIWVLANIRTIRDEQGGVACFEGFLQDITERKNSERTTRAMYAISKAITTSGDLHDLYATIHAILGEVIDATNFYIGLLDPQEDRIVLPYFEDERDANYDIVNVSNPKTKSLTAHVVRTGRPLLVTRDDIATPEHMERTGYIGTLPAVWLGVPLKIKGVIIGAMAVQHYTNPAHYTEEDVSFMEAVSEQVALAIERKANMEELTRLNEELESKVEERTRELGRKATQLETANRRLKALDEIKSGLVSSVSHELRTPLTSIRGFAKLTGKEFGRLFQPLANSPELRRKGERIRQNLDIIGTEGERLTRLINDFLDLNRIESGNATWNDRLLNPCDVVRQSVESVAGAFAANPHVRLATDFPNATPLILADADKIKQVLINLLNNAGKFTERGEIMVRLRATRDALTVSVSDTGIGIPLNEQPLIFDKFHKIRYGDTVVGEAKGTGLGLAICKEIVEHYDGSIWVESKHGRGSTFHFSLPLIQGTMERCESSADGPE